MKASDWLLTCVRQLHTPDVEADPGQTGELLSLEHGAGPVLGRDHLEYCDVKTQDYDVTMYYIIDLSILQYCHQQEFQFRAVDSVVTFLLTLTQSLTLLPRSQ